MPRYPTLVFGGGGFRAPDAPKPAPPSIRPDTLPARAVDDPMSRAAYNTDLSFALSTVPALGRAQAGVIADAGAASGPDGAGLTDRAITAFDALGEDLFAEAPSERARTLAERLVAPRRARAEARAMTEEAARRSAFFRRGLEGALSSARETALADPDAAEDSFADARDALDAAADGWLGREAADALAGDLRRELFPAAARALIARDPADAHARLGAGLFGDHLGDPERTALRNAAKRRAEAVAADDKAVRTREARTADLRADARHRRDVTDAMLRLERGELGRTGLDEMLEAGRIDAAGHEGLMRTLEHRERTLAERAEAAGRVQAILDRARGPFRRRPGVATLPYVPEQVPDPRDVDIWWDDLIVPELDPLPAPARAAIEDRMIASLGAVPAAVLRTVVGGMISEDAAEQVNAARRLSGLIEAAPETFADMPEELRSRAETLADLSDLGMDEARAVEAADKVDASADADEGAIQVAGKAALVRKVIEWLGRRLRPPKSPRKQEPERPKGGPPLPPALPEKDPEEAPENSQAPEALDATRGMSRREELDMMLKKLDKPVRRPETMIEAEEWGKFPESGTVDPERIRTSQNGASPQTRDKRSLESLVEAYRKGGKDAEAIPRIRVTVVDGKVWTQDHRRLIAARRAKVGITYVKDQSPKAVKKITERLSDLKTDGLSIYVRGSGKWE